MHQGYRVVAVTPAGRQRYLEILAPYILGCELIDEWRLWINTNNISDIEWIKSLESSKDKVKLEFSSPSIPVNDQLIGYSIYQYFKNCCDPNTIYIRFDDDICYASPPAIDSLLKCRTENPDNFLVFANIINNSITSHLYQRFGHIKEKRHISYNCVDELGWNNGQFAEQVHRKFLAFGWPVMPNWELNIYERFSINCFAFFGRDFAKFNGAVDKNEEIWLTVDKPRELHRPNLICGNAIVSHFAFYTQRPHLEKTDILDMYRELSKRAMDLPC